MKLVGFTNFNNNQNVYFNPEHVSYVTTYPGKPGTVIGIVGEDECDPFVVKESVPIVLDMLAEEVVV